MPKFRPKVTSRNCIFYSFFARFLPNFDISIFRCIRGRGKYGKCVTNIIKPSIFYEGLMSKGFQPPYII